jgi:TonB family protein
MKMIFFLMLALPVISFGQVKLKKVIREPGTDYPFKEIFHVLKSDKSIKHGPYQRISRTQTMVEGQFDSGESVGIWSTYLSENEILYQYDFDHNALIDSTIHSSLQYTKERVILPNGQVEEMIIDQAPIFPGGEKEFATWLYTSITYPVNARKNSIQGIVEVEFTINENGEMTDLHVVKEVHEYLDQESLRVFDEVLQEFVWIPARHNGQTISVKKTYPVSYKLR